MKKLFFTVFGLVVGSLIQSFVVANYSIIINSINSGAIYNTTGLTLSGTVFSGTDRMSGANVYYQVNTTTGFLTSNMSGLITYNPNLQVGQNSFLVKIMSGETALYTGETTPFTVDLLPTIKSDTATINGKTINYKVETSEATNCVFGANSGLIIAESSTYTSQRLTGISYQTLGDKKIYYNCVDQGGYYVSGDIVSRLELQPIVITNPIDRSLYSGNVHFDWTYGDTVDNPISMYKLTIDDNMDFSSPIHRLDTTMTGSEFEMNNTGRFYVKVEGKSVSGFSGQSQVVPFYINEVKAEDIPTSFQITKLWDGKIYQGDYIPLKITAKNENKDLTGFDGKILFKEKNAKEVFFSIPSFHQFRTIDTGVALFDYQFRALKDGNYTIIAYDEKYPNIQGEIYFDIEKRTEMGFQHYVNVATGQTFTSSEYLVNPSIANSSKIDITTGVLIVNDIERGTGSYISSGDRVKIKINSWTGWDMCKTSVITISGQKKATFGVCTIAKSENDVFARYVPSIGRQSRLLLIRSIGGLFTKYEKNGYNRSELRNKLLEVIQKKAFEENGNYQRSNNIRIRNKSLFRYQVYSMLESIVKTYD